MAAPLVIEDGSMPIGANTYAGLAEADAYLSGRGIAAWAAMDEDSKAVTLIRAADVLNGYRWQGSPVAPGRIMAWPRAGLSYDDAAETPVPADAVPTAVVMAQCELAGELAGGSAPLAAVNTSAGPVTSEKVDVVAVTYGDPADSAYTGVTGFPAVDGLLRPFLLRASRKFGLVELVRG